MPPKKKASSAPQPVEPTPSSQSAPEQDTTMADAPSPIDDFAFPVDLNAAKSAEVVTMKGMGRIRTLPGSTETAASFEFKQEDHTLGNALRYIIMKNPAVEFCGYSIPHPSEELMNVRIQTYEGTALEALEKGLQDLMDLCDIVVDKFEASRDAFNAAQASA